MKKHSIVRRADDVQSDKAHLWFVQECRHKGTPIVMEKARLLYQWMNPDRADDDFKATTGWLQRLKKLTWHLSLEHEE